MTPTAVQIRQAIFNTVQKPSNTAQAVKVALDNERSVASVRK